MLEVTAHASLDSSAVGGVPGAMAGNVAASSIAGAVGSRGDGPEVDTTTVTPEIEREPQSTSDSWFSWGGGGNDRPPSDADAPMRDPWQSPSNDESSADGSWSGSWFGGSGGGASDGGSWFDTTDD